MKKYVLTVSEYFPKTHSKSGAETGFPAAIQNIFNPDTKATKIHTIRGSYDLWEKRIAKINKGEAILSVRIWTGKPYNSKQKEIASFDKVGIEKLEFIKDIYSGCYLIKNKIFIEHIAANDGLSVDDFREWFKKADFAKPMAIIHFTNFRYEK